jgi:hypothetical protein
VLPKIKANNYLLKVNNSELYLLAFDPLLPASYINRHACLRFALRSSKNGMEILLRFVGGLDGVVILYEKQERTFLFFRLEVDESYEDFI